MPSGEYSLIDNTRGNGIHVYNLRGEGSYVFGYIEITDNDNNWTSEEFDIPGKDNAALDVLWGAEMTHDYFFNHHDNRNGVDNQGLRIDHYVHGDLQAFNPTYTNDNAFWIGQQDRIIYGDGENYLDAVTSLDVVAHEIGHGFFEYAIGHGVNQGESGALNEGLSDIWGAMVEYYTAGTDPNKETYLIGEEIHLNNVALRSMSNPKSLGHPDTYGIGSTNFHDPNDLSVDNGGVHINSGVLNHWFYLLAEGSSATDGVNDNGDAFNLTGIGKQDAASVVFRAVVDYFNTSLDFQDARDGTNRLPKIYLVSTL